jgi:hypothetical protein
LRVADGARDARERGVASAGGDLDLDQPCWLTEPANTVSPTALSTGIDSPVIGA